MVICTKNAFKFDIQIKKHIFLSRLLRIPRRSPERGDVQENPSSRFSVYLEATSQLEMPGKPSKGGFLIRCPRCLRWLLKTPQNSSSTPGTPPPPKLRPLNVGQEPHFSCWYPQSHLLGHQPKLLLNFGWMDDGQINGRMDVL